MSPDSKKPRPRTRSFTRLAALLLVIAATEPARADKLEDFREAVAKVGCDAIPYSDPRSNCRSQQDEVHPWCDGSKGPVTCSGRTSDLTSARDAAQRELQALQDKRREIDDRRSRAGDDAERAKASAELEAIDKELDAAKAKLDGTLRDLERRKDLVDQAVYTLNKCIDYRRAVMNVFAYATDKVRGESDPDLRAYATQLRDLYGAQISGHEKQIENKTNALENCKKERP